VHDLIRGDVTFDYAVIDDFVIAKSSGAPLFALANVVDDRRDRITHVIRGEEHLPNAPKQMMLWDALSTVTGHHVAQPVYAHLPLLVNEQRKKLSKRKDPVATEMYRDQGFLADAFVNYLSLLGWGPKGDAEIVDRATCIEQFHLEDVSHSPAFFDVKKLRALNGDYIRAMTTEDFIVAVQPWVAPRLGEWRPTTPPPWSPEQFDPALFTRMAPLIQERVSLLGEVPSMVGFFFQETPAIDTGDADKYFRGDSANQTLLRKLRDTFAHCPFDAASLHTLVLEEGEKLGLNLRKAQAPLRLAVTGSLVGPPLFESLEVLGREKVVQRLTAAIELM
jgi:glutamyl-tRNA synthetase